VDVDDDDPAHGRPAWGPRGRPAWGPRGRPAWGPRGRLGGGRAGRRGVLALAEPVLRALLRVGPVRQAGPPIVEGPGGDLAAQRHVGTHVPGGDENQVRLPRVAVSRNGGLDVAPGAVFGPYPARVAARPLGLAGHGPADRPHAARPVLGVEQVDDRRAAQ